MLNRIALIEQLNAVTQGLFLDIGPEIEIARKAWQEIINDPTFVYKIRQISTPWLVPDWYQGIGEVIRISNDLRSYTVLAVDGSQIYPDRHSGTSCFLINTGSVLLEYGKTSGQPVTLYSRPHVFTGDEKEYEGALATEMVNCKRQEFELQIGLEQSIEFKKRMGTCPPKLAEPEGPDKCRLDTPFAFLFDGSLIFWHLESKEGNLKELFLNKYLGQLDQLYKEKILCAGYISLPKSKELVNLVRVQLCNFKIEGCKELEAVNHLVDSSIARFYLQEHTRTIVFKSNATIGKLYPPHLAPHFFYMDVGQEIVRIEIPAWIAQDEAHLNTISRIMLDQSIKGRGYPVALAEAHEQAVIKSPDRDFFYHLIGKLAIERKRQQFHSQKSMKKRGIGI
jgi:NurA domain